MIILICEHRKNKSLKNLFVYSDSIQAKVKSNPKKNKYSMNRMTMSCGKYQNVIYAISELMSNRVNPSYRTWK